MPCHFVPPVFVCEFLINCLSFRLSTKKYREYKLINDYYLCLETLIMQFSRLDTGGENKKNKIIVLITKFIEIKNNLSAIN
jgi:hypothetical protein